MGQNKSQTVIVRLKPQYIDMLIELGQNGLVNRSEVIRRAIEALYYSGTKYQLHTIETSALKLSTGDKVAP